MSKKSKRGLYIDIEMPLWATDLLPEIFNFVAELEILYKLRQVCKVFDGIVRERVIVKDEFWFENDVFPSFGDYKFESVRLQTELQARNFVSFAERLPKKMSYLGVQGFPENLIVEVGEAVSEKTFETLSLDLSLCKFNTSKWISSFSSKHKKRILGQLVLSYRPEVPFEVKFCEAQSSELKEFIDEKCELSMLCVTGFEKFSVWDFDASFLEARFSEIEFAGLKNVFCFKEMLSSLKRNTSIKLLSIKSLSFAFDLCLSDLCEVISKSKTLVSVVLHHVGLRGFQNIDDDLVQLFDSLEESKTVKHLHVMDIDINMLMIQSIYKFYAENRGKFDCMEFQGVTLDEIEGSKERDFVLLMIVFLTKFMEGFHIRFELQQADDSQTSEILKVLEKYGLTEKCEESCSNCNHPETIAINGELLHKKIMEMLEEFNRSDGDDSD